jgi:hypothetical protein
MPKPPNGTPGKKPPALSVKVWPGGKPRQADDVEPSRRLTRARQMAIEKIMRILVL